MIIKGNDLDKITDQNGGQAFICDGEYGIHATYHGTFFELNIPDELIDKYVAERDKKYHLHVLPGDAGYFQESLKMLGKNSPKYFMADNRSDEYTQVKFTSREIDDLNKQFPYIDFWDCVEEVVE